MKFPVLALLAAALALSPAAHAQDKAAPPEGAGAAQKLNDAISTGLAEAERREREARAAWEAGSAADRQAYDEALAKYQAEVAAQAARQAQVDAEAARQRAAYNAQVAAEAAANAAKQRAYEQALADYNACIAGDRSRCAN